MAPRQCPECGRFLRSELVEGLAEGPADCPGCDVTLTAAMLAAMDETAGDAHGRPSEDARAEVDRSVRPPDLAPDVVRSTDVLAGWDVGATPEELAAWRSDTRPFPTDTLVVAGTGLAGLGLGVLGDRGHRARGAAIGIVGGLVLAATARRIWRLEP